MRISDWSSDVCSSDLPSVGTLSTASTVSFWFGVPRRFTPSGVAFDVDRNALSSTARDDDRDRCIAFNRSYNQILSAHDHSVLEDMLSTPTQPVPGEIGRAPCRDRVCTYV